MRCWRDYHLDLMKDAKNYEDLLYITFDALENIQQPIIMVCGPMTTGNRSKERNFKIFRKTIDRVAKKNNVFDQTVLEDIVQKLRDAQPCSSKVSNRKTLKEFYVPILKSGLIAKTLFIYGWKSSQGATIEYNTARKYGIEIEKLGEGFLKRRNRSYKRFIKKAA